jgi:hypothetical protein
MIGLSRKADLLSSSPQRKSVANPEPEGQPSEVAEKAVVVVLRRECGALALRHIGQNTGAAATIPTLQAAEDDATRR